ncbi:MAG TPA: type I restriction enzyme HsdR N-terminal domain-containing protein [Chitinophagaceae bacterium]
MIKIEFPLPAFRIKVQEGREFIFDGLRKKWILLTPEEWVRQNFVQYLISVINYPSTLIALEKEIKLGELKKRFDILVYDKQHLPWMIVECKEMKVPLRESVLQQALRYNISVPVNYIIITNGSMTYGWQKTAEGLNVIDALPLW